MFYSGLHLLRGVLVLHPSDPPAASGGRRITIFSSDYQSTAPFQTILGTCECSQLVTASSFLGLYRFFVRPDFLRGSCSSTPALSEIGEGGVAVVELLVTAVNYGGEQTAIWQSETACMQQ